MRHVMFLGGADHLQLDPDGKVYHVGDVVTMTDIQRTSLSAAGLRFGSAPDEQPDDGTVVPVPASEAGTPQSVLAAEAIAAQQAADQPTVDQPARKVVEKSQR